jgi:hypothetical protein
VLGRNQRWQYAPLIDEVGGDQNADMLTLAYQKPTPWPYSDAGSRRVLNYLANYKDAARDLTRLGGTSCYDPGAMKDVRSSYCTINVNWATVHSDLADWVCQHYPGEGVVGVDTARYEAICDRIALETEWLADVKDSMLNLQTRELGESALTAYMTVEDLASKVKSEVESGPAKANGATTADALELAATSIELYSVFIPEPFSLPGEFLGGALALAGEITSLTEGDEQGEPAVSEPVTVDPGKLGLEMQERLDAAGAAFGHTWDMLVSDPAKLETAHQRFSDPRGIWNSVPDDLDNAKPMIQNGVRHWAAGKFMAATFDVWMVDTKQIAGPYARDVGPSDVQTIGCDRQYNYGNTVTWPPFYHVPDDAAFYLRDRLGLTQPNSNHFVPRYASNMWVLGQGDIPTKGASRVWPPQSLLSDLYAPPDTKSVDGGYGWERPWLYSRGQRFNVHGPEWTSRRCYWFAQDRYPQK